jgi:hypothetical protein
LGLFNKYWGQQESPMTARIYKFPEIEKTYGYKIPLYSDKQIEVCVIAVNAFSSYPIKINSVDLSDIDPKFVIEGLTKAKESTIIDSSCRKIIITIMNNIEKISL